MNPTSPVPHSSANDAIRAALTSPPATSSERSQRLLALANESGIGGHALSLLERIDLAHLSTHDRITYLRQVTACAAWFEAFQTIATAAVAGPTTGWPEEEVERRVREGIGEAGGDALPEGERLSLESRARDEEWQVRERAIALEVSMATRVSPRTAGRRVDSARCLVEALPRALGEAWVGNWGYGHLRVAEKELLDVPAPLREQVLDDVLPHASTDHPRRLTDRLRKSLAKRDAAGMAGRTRERAEQREVAMWPLKDGQARLAITGPYDAITETMRQLTALGHARRAAMRDADPDAAYTLNAGRFDALAVAVGRLHGQLTGRTAPGSVHSSHPIPSGNLAEVVHSTTRHDAGNVADAVHSHGAIPSGNLAEPQDPERSVGDVGGESAPETSSLDEWDLAPAGTTGSRPRTHAAVIIDAATALHVAEEPGYVPGYGWVPAAIAREILADADSWRRWMLDDSTRAIIDTGAVRYRPSEALRDLVAGRDVTCTADTCNRPASEAQIDHAIDFDGSNTTPSNLHLVCGPDHLAVTAGHFIIDSDAAGRPLWVSTASGHAYPSYVDPLHERSRDADPKPHDSVSMAPER
jgi:hypothetical protein